MCLTSAHPSPPLTNPPFHQYSSNLFFNQIIMPNPELPQELVEEICCTGLEYTSILNIDAVAIRIANRAKRLLSEQEIRSALPTIYNTVSDYFEETYRDNDHFSPEEASNKINEAIERALENLQR